MWRLREYISYSGLTVFFYVLCIFGLCTALNFHENTDKVFPHETNSRIQNQLDGTSWSDQDSLNPIKLHKSIPVADKTRETYASQSIKKLQTPALARSSSSSVVPNWWSRRRRKLSVSDDRLILLRSKRMYPTNEADFTTPMIVQDLKSQIQFFSYVDNNVRCRARGIPEPTVTWYYYINTTYAAKIPEPGTGQSLPFGATGNVLTIYKSKLLNVKNEKFTFFCQAKNIMGLAQSKLMVLQLIPEMKNISVKYETFPIRNNQYAEMTCRPQLEIYNTFLRVKYWKIQRLHEPPQYIYRSEGRYRLINSTVHHKIHIRNMTDAEINTMNVSCVFETTQEPHREIMGKETHVGKFEKIMIDVAYVSLHTKGNRVTVQQGASLELPCALEGKQIIETKWTWRPLNSKVEQSINQKKGSIWLPNLYIPSVDKSHEGKYYCFPEDATINVKEHIAEFTVKVVAPLGVKVTPAELRVSWNEKAAFHCFVSGTPIDKLEWLHNGKRIVANNRFVFSNNSRTLTIPHVTVKDVGVYQCTIQSASFGNDPPTDNAQDSASLLMKSLRPQLITQVPKLSADSSSSQLYLSDNAAATLRCTFAGYPRPHVSWYLDDKLINLATGQITPKPPVPTNEPYTIEAAIEIDMRKIRASNGMELGGEYRAVANNTHGEVFCSIYVLVGSTLYIRPAEKKIVKAIAGESIVLKCYVIGPSMPIITWYRLNITQPNGPKTMIPWSHRQTLTENNRVCTLNEVSNADEGIFMCVASIGKNGPEVTHQVSVIVEHAPKMHMPYSVVELREGNDRFLETCIPNLKVDKPWYAWWRFTPDETIGAQNIGPKNSGNGITISYKELENSVPPSTIPVYKPPDLPDFVPPPNTGSQITINNPTNKKHSGTLTCVIKNKVGSIEHDIKIRFAPDLEFDKKPKNQENVILGRNATFPCSAIKKTTTSYTIAVVWRYLSKSETNEYKVLSDLPLPTRERIKQLSDGSLSIQNVQKTDPRRFGCFLEDTREGSKSKAESAIVNINIKVPATVQKIENQELEEGAQVNLTCRAGGENDSLTMEWERQLANGRWTVLESPCIVSDRNMMCKSYADSRREYEVAITHHNSYEITPSGSVRVYQLIFSKISYDDTGMYRCRAKNKHNFNEEWDTQEFKVTVVSVPKEPQIDSKTLVASHNAISIKWFAPKQDGNKPITYYHITATPIHSLLHINVTQTNVSSGLSTKLVGLRPNTRYRIALAAVNAIGMGAADTEELTTNEAAPDGPVLNLRANGTTSDSISVSWQPPDAYYRNGPIKQYWVCYRRVVLSAESEALNADVWPKLEGNGDMSYVEGVTCEMTTETTFVIFGLPKFTSYGIRVVAENRNGTSPGAFVNTRTMEDLPGKPPTNVQCFGEKRKIKVRWNPPPQESINGIITKYIVNYVIANNLGDETAIQTKQVRTPNAYLEDLRPFTEYKVKVSVANRKGTGPSSTFEKCTTSEDTPGPPQAVKAAPVNDSCVVVSWMHPLETNGIIKAYYVQARRVPNIGYAPESVTRKVLPDPKRDYSFYYYCDLSYMYSYNISVFAQNSYKGNESYSQIVTPVNGAGESIISFGHTVIRQDKQSVQLDCLILPGRPRPTWDYNSGYHRPSDFTEYDNGTLAIHRLQQSYSGDYTCLTYDQADSIKYFLDVREIRPEPARTPLWSTYTANRKGIQITWVSAGTNRDDTPIMYFYVEWHNLFTDERGAVREPASSRNYYLANLTCATQVRFRIRAENRIGNSTWSDYQLESTTGSAPGSANAFDIITKNTIYQSAAYFNLSAFAPGDECWPHKFWIQIASGMDGKLFKNLVYNRTIQLDVQKKCCFNVTELNADSSYIYNITAYNAAGSANVSGHFSTLSSSGYQYTLSRENQKNELGYLDRPSVIVVIVLSIIIFIIICFGLILYSRRSDLQQQLYPDKPVVNDLGDSRRPNDVVAGRQASNMTASRRDDDDDNRSIDSQGNICFYDEYRGGDPDPPVRDPNPTTNRTKAAAPQPSTGSQGIYPTMGGQPRRVIVEMNGGMPYQGVGSHAYDYPVMTRTRDGQFEEVPSGRLVARRRTDSFENLHRIPRGQEAPYSRGMLPSGTIMVVQTPYYDPKTSDGRSSQYRGSVLSSATAASSNHEELMRINDPRRHQTALTLPPGGLQRLQAGWMNRGRPVVLEGGYEEEGGSGDSEETDPGIRHFTERPPRPEEAFAQRPGMTRTAPQTIPAGRPMPGQMSRGISQMSDATYESVDYRPPPYKVYGQRPPNARRLDSAASSSGYDSNDVDPRYYSGASSAGVRRKVINTQQPVTSKAYPQDLAISRSDPNYRPPFTTLDPSGFPLPSSRIGGLSSAERQPLMGPPRIVKLVQGGVPTGALVAVSQGGLYGQAHNPNETVSLLNRQQSERRRRAQRIEEPVASREDEEDEESYTEV